MARLLPTMIAAQLMTAMLVVVSVLVVGSLAAGTCFDANNQEFVYDAQRVRVRVRVHRSTARLARSHERERLVGFE